MKGPSRGLVLHRRGVKGYISLAGRAVRPGTGTPGGVEMTMATERVVRGLLLVGVAALTVVGARPYAGGWNDGSRLAAVESLYAITIHKAQGSQFGHVVVRLPAPSSPVLTRELLYTAVTRAQRRLTVLGTEAAVRAAVARPVARASGLTAALTPP